MKKSTGITYIKSCSCFSLLLPAMQKDILIIGCNGYVAAIDTIAGKEIWRTKLREGMLGGSRGNDVSVLVADSKVLAGCNGRIYGLNIADGSILWSNDLEGIGFNEVALAMQGVHTQYITRVERHTASH